MVWIVFYIGFVCVCVVFVVMLVSNEEISEGDKKRSSACFVRG